MKKIKKILVKLVLTTNILYSKLYYNFYKVLDDKRILLNLGLLEKISKFLDRIYSKVLRLLGQQSENFPPNRSSFGHRIARDFVNYSRGINNNAIFSKLDDESLITVEMILNRMWHIYLHSYIKKEDLLTINEKRQGKEAEFLIKEFRESLELPFDHYCINVFYYHSGLKLIPERVLLNLKDKEIIDGGAYFGDSAIIFEKFYDFGPIHCFEPDPKNFYLLQKLIEMHNLHKKIIPLQQALGEISKLTGLESRGPCSFISEGNDNLIQMTTIDDYVFKNSINVGIIKLDLEGYDLEAIKGALNTIRKHKPLLLISIYHNAKEFFEIPKLVKKIVPDYTILIRKLNPISLFDETCLLAWVE